MLLYSLDGRLLSTYSAYEWSLGIKSVVWSPSSQFLAIGSYDEKVQPPQKHNLLIAPLILRCFTLMFDSCRVRYLASTPKRVIPVLFLLSLPKCSFFFFFIYTLILIRCIKFVSKYI